MSSPREPQRARGMRRRPGTVRGVSRSLRQPCLYPFLTGASLLILFLHKMIFTNLILARGDILLYFYPYWQKAAEALRAGQVPLWNPHLFMGVPFVANSQVGFFYPLNWPLWLALSPTVAVKATIVLHLALAGTGTYVLARRRLSLSPWAATLSAALFAFGGYLTSQVEHVNQLQGLAWLPWLLLACEARVAGRFMRSILARVLALALLLALQLSAGHVQTVFISGIALVLWCTASVAARVRGREYDRRPEKEAQKNFPVKQVAALGVPLLAGSVFAFFLAGVQLLPTLELAGLSSRQGGLSVQEATSFSLHPLLLSASLLPAYGRSLFSEYVAFLPVTALLLAAVGVWHWKKDRKVASSLALAVGGLFLALGRFNPLYLLLARLPGFDLFRAPARWLVLYALGMALLAGAGWDLAGRSRWRSNSGEKRKDPVHRGLRLGVAVCTALVAWHYLSVPLARYVPVGAEAEATFPSWPMLLGWLAELLIAYALLDGRLGKLTSIEVSDRLLPVLLTALPILALYIASRSQPYHDNLTAPAAYTDPRPAIARLQAMQRCDLLPAECLLPPGRILSLSDIFFDPGDLGEIRAVYGDQLSEEALFDYVVAVKQKAIVAPNLPLAYGLYSVDGFDGGVLPLRDYSSLVQLLLPSGVTTTDGRLREHLEGVPEARWLDLFNARYLITDKVGDTWRQGVFFDMQHPVTLAAGETVPVGAVPDFEATELWMIAEGEQGSVFVDAGSELWEITPQPAPEGLKRARFPQAASPQSITLEAGAGRWRVLGMALVDGRDGTFRSVVPGNYRQIHSGDVKIYENLDVLPRAFQVQQWQWQPDASSSVAQMSSAGFDPREEAIVAGDGEPARSVAQAQSRTVISSYSSDEIVVETASTVEGMLVVADAYYPGWRATLDGETVPVYQVNGYFRGVFVPAGSHRVRLEFRPRSYLLGRWISLSALLLWVSLSLLLVATHRRRGKIETQIPLQEEKGLTQDRVRH